MSKPTFRVTYRTSPDLGRCKDCQRVARLVHGYCRQHAKEHGYRVPESFGRYPVTRR